MRLIIDSAGDSLDLTSFVKEHGLTSAAQIKKLANSKGYIWFERTKGACIIWLDPGKVTAASEAALYYLISDVTSDRASVTFVGERDQSSILPSGTSCINAISQEIARARRERTARFASRPIAVASIAAFRPLQKLFDLLQSSEIHQDVRHVASFVKNTVTDRFLIVDRADSAENVIVRIVGPGYSGFDKRWVKKAAGCTLEEQPDIDYGVWLTRCYLAVLERNTIIAEEVDAAIYRPEYGRRRFAYRRLLLPFKSKNGGQCLLSTSIADPSIDLGIN